MLLAATPSSPLPSTLKSCTKCGETKPVSAFTRWCRPCVSAYNTARRLLNGDGIRTSKRAHYALNADRLRAEKRSKRASDPEAARAARREYHVRRPDVVFAANLAKYGITPTEYRALLLKSHGECAICTRQFRSEKEPCLDHDHTRADRHVRGLLCANCNTLLGHARDNSVTLRAAIKYLKRTTSND